MFEVSFTKNFQRTQYFKPLKNDGWMKRPDGSTSQLATRKSEPRQDMNGGFARGGKTEFVPGLQRNYSAQDTLTRIRPIKLKSVIGFNFLDNIRF